MLFLNHIHGEINKGISWISNNKKLFLSLISGLYKMQIFRHEYYQDVFAYVKHQTREYVFWINTIYHKYIADECCTECTISHWQQYRSSSSWHAEFDGNNF